MADTIYKYATRDDRGWDEAYDSPRVFTSGLVCGRDAIVYELELVEVSEDDGWDFVGWRDFRFNDTNGEGDDVSLVWPNFRAFEMCFTYGVDAEVEAGRGEIVYMQLVDHTELGAARDL